MRSSDAMKYADLRVFSQCSLIECERLILKHYNDTRVRKELNTVASKLAQVKELAGIELVRELASRR